MLSALVKAQAVARRLAAERPSGYRHNNKGRPSDRAESFASHIPASNTQPDHASLVVDSSASFSDSIIVPWFYVLLLQAHRCEYSKWIQQETGVSMISVGQAISCSEDDSKRIILQAKAVEYLQLAKELINRELKERIFEQYPIPANKMGTLIGKGGETIKGLQDRAQGCKIWVSNPAGANNFQQQEQENSSSERMVSFFGSEKELEQAKCLVNQVVYGALEGDVVAVYQIPDYSCSGLIGKRAENIKMLQQRTGASMFLDNAVGKASKRLVWVTGRPEAVKAAFHAIQQQLGVGDVVVDVSATKRLPASMRLPEEGVNVETRESVGVEVETDSNVSASSAQTAQTPEEYQQAMAAYYAAAAAYYAQNPAAYAAYCQQYYYGQYYGGNEGDGGAV
jgi:hypothetical protein